MFNDANLASLDRLSFVTTVFKRLEIESNNASNLPNNGTVEGDTSSFQSAHELGQLCQNKSLVVNLIPYNQTDVKDKLRCPNFEHIRKFLRIVSSYGVFCTIRRTMGADIDSACGQLIVAEKQLPQSSSSSNPNNDVVDIEDSLPGGTIAAIKKGAVKKLSQSTTSSTTDKEGSRPQGGNTGESANDPLDLEQWVRLLQVATAIAASCFLFSSAMYIKQRKR